MGTVEFYFIALGIYLRLDADYGYLLYLNTYNLHCTCEPLFLLLHSAASATTSFMEPLHLYSVVVSTAYEINCIQREVNKILSVNEGKRPVQHKMIRRQDFFCQACYTFRKC